MSLRIMSDGGRYRLERDGREIGWAEGSTIGFRGFKSAVDSRRAAGVAYDALRVWGIYA